VKGKYETLWPSIDRTLQGLGLLFGTSLKPNILCNQLTFESHLIEDAPVILETYLRFLYKDRITTTVNEKEVPVQSETESELYSPEMKLPILINTLSIHHCR